MKKIVDLDQFRRKEPQPKPEAPQAVNLSKAAPAASSPERQPPATPQKTDDGSKDKPQKLTKPAQDFRRRFEDALNELKAEALEELAKAKTKEEFKKKINVSLVLKRAKSSPLTAYSPLHRDFLLPKVEAASLVLKQANEAKFTTVRRNPEGVQSLKTQLKKQKIDFEQQLATLASQKLSLFIKREAR